MTLGPGLAPQHQLGEREMLLAYLERLASLLEAYRAGEEPA